MGGDARPPEPVAGRCVPPACLLAFAPRRAYGHRSRLELAPPRPTEAQTVALLPQHLHDRFLFTSPKT